jgi:hypothetical protein
LLLLLLLLLLLVVVVVVVAAAAAAAAVAVFRPMFTTLIQPLNLHLSEKKIFFSSLLTLSFPDHTKHEALHLTGNQTQFNYF